MPRAYSVLFIGLLLLSACHGTKRLASNEKFVPQDAKKLEAELHHWLNVPYRFGGNSSSGIDCSGLVYAVYKKVYGLELPRTSKSQYAYSKAIKKEEARAGDLVFFDINGTGVSHVGIYMGEDKFIHASTSKGVIYSSLSNTYYLKRLVRFGRVL